MPADEGNYTVNKLDTYNVYLLKKDVSSSGETAKQGYYRLNDEGTKYVLCTESGQVLDNSNGIKKDLFENEILYPGDEFKEVTELIAKKSFVPSGSESQQNVDFTFDPEELAGKSYVITQDLYFDKLQDAGTVFDDETADVYAVLYSDGTLSFQKRKDTYPSKTVVEVYPFNEKDHFIPKTGTPWWNNRENVKSVEFRDKIRPLSTSCWFWEFENATSINLKNLDTSRTTSMYGMFWKCKGLTKLDVSGLDTSNVTDMAGMFAVCSNLTNLAVSNFDTSKVTNMHSMFDSCHKLQEWYFVPANIHQLGGADCLIVAAIGYSLDFYGFYAVIIGLILTLPYTAYMKITKKEHVYPLIPFLTTGYIIILIILTVQGQSISWLL